MVMLFRLKGFVVCIVETGLNFLDGVVLIGCRLVIFGGIRFVVFGKWFVRLLRLFEIGLFCLCLGIFLGLRKCGRFGVEGFRFVSGNFVCLEIIFLFHYLFQLFIILFILFHFLDFLWFDLYSHFLFI